MALVGTESASSSRAGPTDWGATFGCGRRMRWSSRAIGRTERIASPGPAQTAIVIGHKAQIWQIIHRRSPYTRRQGCGGLA